MGEKTGLPIYCESSPTTFKLYLKFGFQVLEEKLIHSKDVLGTEEDIVVPLMVKMPTAARGISFEEWRERGYPSWEEVAKTRPMPVTKTKETETLRKARVYSTPKPQTIALSVGLLTVLTAVPILFGWKPTLLWGLRK